MPLDPSILLGQDIRSSRTERYFHRQGDRRILVHYAPAFESAELRDHFSQIVRVIIYSDPMHLDPDYLPLPTVRQGLETMEEKLIKTLQKQSVKAYWAGSICFDGKLDMAFLVSDLEGFKAAYTAWYNRQKAYRIRIAFSEDIPGLFKSLFPPAHLRRQISDGLIIEQVRKSKTNEEALHWLELTFSGEKKDLKSLYEEIRKENMFIVTPFAEMPDGPAKMVLATARKLELEPVFRVTSLAESQAQLRGVKFEGWSTAPVRAATLTGSNKNGYGEYIWDNGLVYKGEWKKGERNGFGRMYFADGSYFEGDFKDNKRTGKGLMAWTWDEWYYGDFVKGSHHGRGEYHWPNGAVFEGDWVDGNRTGKGVYQWKSGDIYRGDYVNDLRHGQGRIDYKDGGWFEGTFVNSKMTGFGREFEPDKNRIVEGTLVDGTWQKDKKITPLDDQGAPQEEKTPPPLPETPAGGGGAAPGGRPGVSDDSNPVGQAAPPDA